MGRTVNPLSFDFSGSNPLLPTFEERLKMKVEVRRFDAFQLIPSYFYLSSSGSSSVGRAIAFQAIGRGFEPRLPLRNGPMWGRPLGNVPL